MSQPWTTVVKQWTPSGFYDWMASGAVALYLNERPGSTDATVQKCITQMTEFYRRTLIARFKRSYPQTARQMMTYALERFAESQRYLKAMQERLGANDPWGVMNGFPVAQLAQPTANMPAPYSTIVGSYWYDLHPKPPFPLSSPPVDGVTLAGQADNGDFCADMSFEALYINRGTKASPVWHRFRVGGISNTSDHPLIDYINNPEELLDCGYNRVRYYIRDRGMDSDAGDFISRLDKMPGAAKLALNRASEEEELAFSILEVDESADGILSDYELGRTGVTEWAF